MSGKVERGDRVRFLNEVGGGIVTRLEGNLVFVEDEDDFEVPVPVSEVVVVEKASDAETTQVNNTGVIQEPQSVNEPVSEKEAYHEELEEEHDEFNPRFYLAFTKGGISNDLEDQLFVHIINDSNYYCVYLITQLGDDGMMYALHQGTIQPNTKLQLGEMMLKDLEATWNFQLLLFKKGKPFPALAPVSSNVHIKAKKFFKQNSFAGNDFFYQPAVLMSIIKNELESQLEKLTEKETLAIIREKETKEIPRQAVKRQSTPELLEIDLHINELIDSVAGLSNGEILQIQLDKFNAVMEANLHNRGRRVVFIHGVGNGVLKNELRKQLERKYKKVDFQDASFKEYGYGATMVIIK